MVEVRVVWEKKSLRDYVIFYSIYVPSKAETPRKYGMLKNEGDTVTVEVPEGSSIRIHLERKRVGVVGEKYRLMNKKTIRGIAELGAVTTVYLGTDKCRIENFRETPPERVFEKEPPIMFYVVDEKTIRTKYFGDVKLKLVHEVSREFHYENFRLTTAGAGYPIYMCTLGEETLTDYVISIKGRPTVEPFTPFLFMKATYNRNKILDVKFKEYSVGYKLVDELLGE